MQKEVLERTTYSQNANDFQYRRGEVAKEKRVIRSYNFVWLIIGVIETLLLFRFIFELLSANPYNGFVQLIYTLSYPFAAPFQDIFRITYVSSSIMNWSILVAMVVYLIIGYGINQIFNIVLPTTTTTNIRHKVHPS